jgi:aspartate ammonia-lyase
VNLGGGAIGTGLSVPRYFIMEASGTLQKLSGLPIARAENLSDATSNLDPFVEVHAILKAHAVNLEKMVSDIRLLASDLTARTISIPERQVGSSIMPGKINPVIPEFVVGAAHRVYANDQIITSLSALGCLELNAYLPAIGHALLDSLKLLNGCNETVKSHLITGLVVHAGTGLESLYRSPAITTALVTKFGYTKASEVAKRMKENGMDVFSANAEAGLASHEELQTLLRPDNLLKLGFTLTDL